MHRLNISFLLVLCLFKSFVFVAQNDRTNLTLELYENFHLQDQLFSTNGNELFLKNVDQERQIIPSFSLAKSTFSTKSPLDPPTLDLDEITPGDDYEFFLEPTTGNVFRTTRGNVAITSDTGTISSATITVTGNIDANELFAIPADAGGFDIYFFTASNTNTYNRAGGLVIQVAQTGTSFTITETSNTPIPNAILEDFLEIILYGDLNSPYTEGLRTVDFTLNDTTGGSTTSQTLIHVVVAPDAVDDANSVNANSVTPITGNVLTNDTDNTTGGDVLSVSEINVFPSAVGTTYNTLYGSVTIQSDGSYSYLVDTSSPAVAGLTSSTSLDDIIAYTVEDSSGAFDYGILTITINGVDDPPVAVDDNNSVSVGVVNTATGNVIDGDGSSGQDLLDRPLSRLIWENEFTNGAVVGGQTRTIDGVNVDFTSLDPSGAGNAFNQTSQNTLTNGGHTGYLLFNIDPATNPVSDTQLIIDFDQEVFNVGFLVTDIDYSQGTVWQDQVTIQGFSGGSPTPVNYNFIRTGGIVEAGSDTFYGTGTAVEEDATGNINIAFQAPIDQLVISYNYGPNVTDADPGGQIAGVSDIFWQGDNVVIVSEVNGVAANVGNSIPTMYGFLTINSDGSYTYVLDQSNPAVMALAAGATLIDTTPYTLRDAALNTDSANLIITIVGTLDTDGDDIPDEVDLDDDNDGITDTLENDLGVDPSADADNDGILNFEDADNNGSGGAPTCTDGNTDGICDDLDTAFDRDQDGVPNHLDLDSDNDGIYDALEAGHNQTQVNGVVSGAVGTDGIPDAVQGVGNENSGTINYTLTDSDTDNDDNFLELDSDNDGCNDVIEAGFTDNDNNGFLGNGTFGSGLTVDSNGVVTSGSDGYTGTNSDVVTPGTAPSITTQPTNSAICPNSNTTFSAVTSNADTYQWQLFNGSSWDDLTNSGIHSTVTTTTLTITNAPVAADGNRYRLIASSSTYLCTVATSNEVELTVEDVTDPTASNPAPITAQCTAPTPDITVVTDEADNCGTPTVAFVSDVSDGNSNPEVITRTYSVTDAAGNSINVTQTITINDTTDPTASNPAPISAQCAAPTPDITVVTDEADNCGTPTVAFVSDVSDGNSNPEVITRTYSVTDAAGNSINVTQTITINDTTDPTASNPAPISAQCAAPTPDITVVTDEADNCGTPTVAFVSDVSDGNSNPEVITRTYSVTDAAGNSINVTQTITINDTTDPTASNPSPISAQCAAPTPDITVVTDEADNCGTPTVAFVSDVSDGNSNPEVITRTYSVTDAAGNSINVTQTITINDTTDPTASNPAPISAQCAAPTPDITVVTDEADNCGTPTVAFVSDVSDGNSNPEVITRTYSVTDAAGNSINVTQTITINDTTDPTASNPAPISAQCAAPTPDITVVTDEADNCGTPTVAFVSDVSDGNSNPEVITRTYSVTDAAGNSINVTQTITINDTTDPTASNPAPISAQCAAPTPDITVVTDEADNCGTPTVAFVSDVSDGNSNPEVITRTYSVTDAAGNSINVTQTITINDTTDPTASNPSPISAQCAAPTPDITVVTDEADNCGTPTVAFVSDVSDGNSNPEVITRTYSVTDAAGNSINVTQTITINDTTDPTASNPSPISAQCAAPTPDVTVVTDEADNCGTPTVAFVSDVSDGNSNPEVITRTYSVTDAAGNSINVTQTITINDTTDPTASNPSPISAQCAAPTPDVTVVTDEADNCGTPTVAFVSDVSDGNSNPEVITRTYSVTDAAGNSINVTQTITINDTTDPTASNPAPISAQCAAPTPDVTVVTDEADNCGTPTVAFVSDVSDGNSNPEVITRTYSVTDAAGNSINVTQTITINDTTDPTASNPSPISAQCAAPTPDVTVVTDEADNCGTPTVAFVSDVSDGNSNPEVITRTYSVTDAAGNSINVTQTITINDTTDPTASNPSPISAQCAAPTPDITVVTDEADNCGTPTVAFVSDVSDGNSNPEVITRTYSVTDAAGNSINVTQTITINDTTDPTASNPAPISAQCAAPTPDITVVTDEADNCGTPTVAFVSDVSDGNSNPEVITRTYSVTDAAGNSINVTQTITINDTTDPTASNPAPISAQCAAPTPDITVVTDEADNCGTPTVAFVSDVSDGNSNPEVITRTYSVTDAAGNSINVTQTITINDTTDPTASNPAPISAQCAAPTPDITVVTDEADNCGTPTVAFVSDVSDGNSNPEVITRTYSVTDAAGNSINVTQTITINDTTDPTASNPSPISAQCAAPTPDVTVVTDEADNCGTPTVAFVSDVSDGNSNPEVITRTYSVTDAAGNSINVTQTITINDTTDPTASNPSPISAQCAAPTPDVTVVTDEADNCGTPTVAFVSDVSDGNSNPEVITRTYSVTDAAGNSINVTQTITINDTTDPTASNPAPISAQCAAPTPDVTVVTDEADNCGTPTVAFVSDVSDGNSNPEVITRTYSVTDAAGNSINVTQTITINDTTDPTASNPAPISAQCAAPTPDVTVVTDEADNCGTPTVAFVSDVSDGNSNPEVITRTYSVTDAAGNSINVTQTITINDTTDPTASNPSPISAQCAAPTPDITVVTDEADNCGTPTVAFVSDVSDGNSNPEVITRTYSVTDAAGNSINVTQTITINDTTDPTASNPAPISAQCAAPTPDITVVTDEADNCGTPTVAFVSDVSDGNSNPEVITRTYSVTDAAGNSINVTQTITINDTTDPTASNPAPISAQCAAPTPDVTVVTDEADNCGTPTVAFVSDVSDGNSNPEVITRTYSVTDAAGNSINVTQTITINDTTDPTASNPAPISAQCAAPTPDITVVTDEADNCGTPTVAFVSDVSDGNSNPEVITRTYSVTDAAGNSINVTQTITINDTTDPTASNPSPISAQCAAPTPDITVVTDEADNCGTPTVAFVSDVSDGNSNPEVITRTYSVTDAAGNSINVTQTITINDTTDPTASNPSPISAQCAAPTPDITVVTDEADNCGTPTVAFVSDVSDGNSNPEVITRTYSVTDAAGNSINVTQTITINDTTDPTASNPAPISAQCAAPTPDITVVTDEADNCGTPTVAFVSDVSDGNSNPEVITRTYSVTDAAGNSINVTQTITINDTTDPTASNPAPISAQCAAPTPDITVVTDEADNCGTPTVAFVSDVSDGNSNPEVITRTYSVTDAAGNSINVTQTITINDTTDPTASNPAPISAQCAAPTPDITVVTDEADNCGTPTVAFVSDVSDGNSNPEVITRTYSVTDAAGNSINVTQTITINDTTDPTASNPAPISAQCAAPTPDITVVTDEADNCGTPTVAFVSDVSDGNSNPEVITRTYSVTDAAGNSINVTQTITINDTTDPTASNPAPISAQCAAPTPDITVVTDEADNCGTPTVAFVSDVSDGNSNPEVITRTYSVTDAAGNSINVTQTITINDTTDPTASNPSPISAQCAAPTPDVTVVTDEADNCGTPTVAFVSDVSDGNSNPEVITRTYSVTDAAGNSINVTQTITINDTTDPTASNPAPISAQCAAPTPDITVVTDEADNCGTPTVAFVSDVSDGNSNPEVITRTYSVTDAAGNSINVTQTITINDTTDPTASNPAPISAQCAAPTPDITVVTDEADNCGTPTVAFVSDVSDGNSNPEVITRTYSVTDAAGNSINVTQTITINDTTDPTASNPSPISAQCAAPTPDVTVVTDEADNCGTPTVAFVSDVSDGNSNPEVITRTYSVTDAAGNSINVTQTITINDTTDPTASNPSPISAQCAAPTPDITVVTDEADNCGTPTVAFVSDVSDGNSNPEVITRTYSVTDAAGNSINVTQTITINDTTDPTASNPAPISAQCAAPTPDITVVTDEADNCGTPTVAFVSDVSDGNSNPEVITRTYSVTDAAGNSINVTQTITINDTTDPTASNPAPISAQCAAPTPDITVVTDEADNCGTPTVAFVSDVSDGNSNPEVITRTYSVTDAAGNSINVTQTITINDTTDPTASNPAPISAQCAAPTPDITVVTDEADNCGTPTVAFVSDVSDGNSNPEVITRTYSVTDAAGNSINVTQTITINDTTDPTASNPSPISAQCAAPTPDVTVVTDEADNCGTPTVAFVSDVSDGNSNPEVITRTYSVTDAAGNSINVTQTITINDTTDPTASNPSPISAQCAAPTPDVTVVTDEADNCGTPTVAFVSDVSDGNSNPEVITRTYSVTDAAGNSINVTQTITINDTTDPTASNPAPITAQCAAPTPDITVVTDEADNCGTPTIAFVSDVSDGNSNPEVITRTYSVTDAAGNSINVTQTITINDTTDPTASNPAPITAQCAAPTPDITVVTDEADNCGTPTVAFVSDVSDGNSNPEVITRTYSVTDAAGNSINVTQTITINDTTDPTASNPAPITAQCAAPTPDITVVTDEADNCGTPTVAFVSDVSDGNSNPEVITRTYSVTDAAGNSINVTQTITINDTTDPTASNPAPITAQCAAPTPDITVVTDEADNCGTPTVAFVSDVSDGNSNPEVITRTYNVTDAAGNSINVTQTITINDTTDPTASNPAPITEQCAAPTPDITVVTDEADNCGTPTVTFVSDVNTSVGIITRTYSVTDAAGNSINVTQTITINDTTDPTASNPAPITEQCAAPVPDITVVTDEADNCGTPTVAFVSDVSDGNSNPEVITRTYSVTDAAGNSINVTQTITINDTIDPAIACPSDITQQVDMGSSSAVVNFSPPVGTDNCSGVSTTQVSGLPSGSAFPVGVTTNTFEVTDGAGNTAICSFDVIISAEIIANDDEVLIDGGLGGNSINVVDSNDLLNNNGAMLGVNVSITNIVDPDPSDGVSLDPLTGEILVLPGTPSGEYNITYTLCNTTAPIVCDDAVVSITVTNSSNANLSLTKTGSYIDSNGDNTLNAGDEIHYTFTVENNGNVDVNDILLMDELAGITVVGGPVDLAVGEIDVNSFSAIYVLTEEDVLAGSVSNQATVAGITPSGQEVVDVSDDPLNNTNIDIDGDGDFEDVTITSIGFDEVVTIYTGFSPNGDGVNDVLVINGIEQLENKLEIFNRWGIIVYEAEGYGRDGNFFEGISNGRTTIKGGDQLPVGTYYYVLEYVLETGEQKRKVGFLYINR